jgi:hypothetical protein
MNCSIVNAYPQNVSIDAATMTNRARNAFKFTFYGDRTIGADYFIYEMNTNNLWNNNIYSDYAAGAKKLYYYNTEEIDTLATNVSSNNNKQFVWKVRVYDDVDIANSKNPNIRVVSGTTKASPFISGKTLATVLGSDGKANKKMLDLDTTETITLPSWITVNGERRIILEARVGVDQNQKPVKTRIRLKNETTDEVAEGTEYTISPYRNVKLQVSENGLFIAPDIAIDESETTDHRVGHIGGRTDLPYPTTNQPCYYLEINGEFRAIKTYKKSLGYVELISAFSTTPDVGTDYTLYCSYIESPFFYFETEPTPVIENLQGVFDAEVIKFTASLNSKSFTKYQKWEIYDVTNTSGNITSNSLLVDTSEKMYIGALEYVFRGYVTGHSYKAKLYVTTQTNWDVEAETPNAITSGSAETNINSIAMKYNKEKNAIELTYKHIKALTAPSKGLCGTKILRQEYGSNEIIYVATLTYNSIKANQTNTFIDYDSVSRKKYRYYICDFVSTGDSSTSLMYLPAISQYYDTDFYTYSIYFLQEQAYTRFDVQTDKRIDYDYMYAERSFNVIDIVRPELNVVDKHSISHNLGRNTYVGYAVKASTAAWETTYDTFSLSFQLGNTEVKYPDGTTFDRNFTQDFANSINYGWNEVINKDEVYYKHLKELIASGIPVMIKDYRGNKWFGSIVSHNSEIDNTQPVERSITEKLDFVETYPISKVRILSN